MADPVTWLAIGAGVSAVGTGVSAYSSYQQGKTASAMAQYNAHQQELNTRMQLMSVQAQAAIQKRMAEAQFALRSSEAQARFNNAKSIENQAAGKRSAVRETIRRQSMEHDRALAATRANIAKSGFVESTGSPMDVAMRVVELNTLENLDTLHAGQLEQNQLFREADMERFGGRLALAGATLDKSSLLSQSLLTGAAGRLEYNKGMREAEIMRLTGAAQKQGYQTAAFGTLLSGVGSAAGMYGTAIK